MRDLTNSKSGKLTVLSIHSRDKHGHIKWLCRCNCGNEAIVLSDNLIRNHTTSCGCERTRINSEVHKTHGKRYTKNGQSREYTTWCNMLSRCRNPKGEHYSDYGGRGISVCEKWYTFEGFWEDMENGYIPSLTIDRIDVNGNYCKENCRWATIKEQANNRRSNHYVFYCGEKMTLQEACQKREIDYHSVAARLKLGWNFEKVIETPIRQHHWRNKEGA